MKENRIIIDSHAHLEFFQPCGLEDTADKVIKYMEYAGISHACISTYTNIPGMNSGSIEYYMEVINNFPDKFYPFLRMDPGYGDEALKILDIAVKKYNYKGIKLHPIDYSLPPFEHTTIEILKRAAEYDIPVLYHCSDEIMCLPLQIECAAIACPEAKIILGHMGGFWHQDDAINIAKRNPNIFLETCEQPYITGIQKAVREIGAERILFGTDMPTDNPKLEVEKIYYAQLSEEQLDKIFYKNISKLLNLEGK